MIDICVFAGRFRPFHEGHKHIIDEALRRAQYVFLIVGSCHEPINFRNPFTYEQVREMIRGSFDPLEADRIFIFGVEDSDSDLRWVRDVQKIVTQGAARLKFGRPPEIALIGHSKDGSSYYLQLFPQWGAEAVSPKLVLDATHLREELYLADDPMEALVARRQQDHLPMGTYLFLREWVHSAEFERMRAEHAFMVAYLADFPQTPYPRFFTAADACVIQAGAVLLVRRGEMPGEGQWALPGGHVKIDETFQTAALRELVEETNFAGWSPDDPNAIPSLRLFVRGEKVLDNPWRSTRKRTVSIAYGLLIPGTERPTVKGMDDAKEARWWDIDEVTREMMFEDHYGVIEDFANRFRNIVL